MTGINATTVPRFGNRDTVNHHFVFDCLLTTDIPGSAANYPGRHLLSPDQMGTARFYL